MSKDVSRTPTRGVFALAGLALSVFTFNTTENLPVGLLDLIAHDLEVSIPATGSLVAVYGMIVAATSVPLAHVGRPLPRRYVLACVLIALIASTWVSARADDFAVLFGARIATALAQAMFWAVMAPAAVGLFRPEVRGRVVGVLFAGGSLATVVGVPAGTWLGYQDGWRVPFFVLVALALAAFLVVTISVPTTRPGSSHSDFGATPDSRRYAILLVTTGLSTTGAFTSFTYITPFLRDVAAFDARGVSLALTLFGAGGLVGVLMVGAAADRFQHLAVAVPVTGQALVLSVLFLFGEYPWVTATGLFTLGLTAAPVFAATQGRVLLVAPRRTDTASAANSAAFNVGIAAGSALGGLILHSGSVRQTFAAGATVSLAAVAAVWSERLLNNPRPSLPGGRVDSTH